MCRKGSSEMEGGVIDAVIKKVNIWIYLVLGMEF